MKNVKTQRLDQVFVVVLQVADVNCRSIVLSMIYICTKVVTRNKPH